MTKHLLIIFITLFAFVQLNAQSTPKEKKGWFYFALGSHRAFYTPSSIRFVGYAQPNFDFTLEKLKGRDDEGLRLKSSPQYSYNLGYYSLKNKWGIEFQFDHLKYILRENQVARITGYIGNQEFDRDTLVGPDLVQLEHTDGANYAMINLVKWKNLAMGRNQNSLDLVLKAGGGVVVPKTNSTILGVHNDDRYAISGFVVGIEPGVRYNFLKNVFLQAGVKGAYANYKRFRIAYGYGSQQWYSLQFNLMFGVQFSH